jgi:hypothetical protein
MYNIYDWKVQPQSDGSLRLYNRNNLYAEFSIPAEDLKDKNKDEISDFILIKIKYFERIRVKNLADQLAHDVFVNYKRKD